MRTSVYRGLAVLAATAGLVALGATSAQAADGGSAASPGTSDPLAQTVQQLSEMAGHIIPGMPEGASLEVPSIIPGVPSISLLPLSLPGLPITPSLPLP